MFIRWPWAGVGFGFLASAYTRGRIVHGNTKKIEPMLIVFIAMKINMQNISKNRTGKSAFSRLRVYSDSFLGKT